MADEETNKRIILSRRVLSGWERLTSASPAEDQLRMIGDEIMILQAIIEEFPEKALTVGDLVKRYRALQGRVRERAH